MPISEETFLTSLKRIDRQYGGSHRSRIPGVAKERKTKQPPDEASYNVGKGLARSLLDLSSVSAVSKEVQEEMFTLLADRHTNPAVCQGFFDSLSETEGGHDLDLEDLFASCILYTEQIELQEQDDDLNNDEDDDCGTFFGPLTCMIRAYARRVRFGCEQKVLVNDAMYKDASSTIARTYSKLQTQAGRLAMLREFTDLAFVRPKQQQDASPSNACFHQLYSRILDPLLTCSVISPKRTFSDRGDSTMIESMLCMEGIWRQVDVLIEDTSNANDGDYAPLHSVLDVITWLTGMLDLYLLSITSRKRQQRIVSKELAHRWLVFVLDVRLFVAQSFEHDNDNDQRQNLMDWFEGIISRTLLRWFSVVPSYRIPMGSFWVALKKLMSFYTSQNAVRLEPVLKLSTMALCHPIKEDVKEILGVLAIAAESTQQLHPIVISMMKGLGSIFSRDPVCAATAKHLVQILMRTKSSSSTITSSKKFETFVNLIQIFEDGHSVNAILSYFVSYENELFGTNITLSTIQQAGSLVLFGIGLLGSCSEKKRQNIYIFLDKLLLPYPHLGISLLPVLLDSINESMVLGDADRMMEQIDFLAEVLVRDPQCAREIWNLLGKEFMRETVPVAIRSYAVRLFPKICQANKKLYKRVIEVMGNALVTSKEIGENIDNDFELRLAIAASTADLAGGSFIRDPTDVISWLQDFITDTGWVRPISILHRLETERTKETIAHYSILALNSLVVAGDLDFKLVLVVLGKKLCDIHNVDEVSMLPPLVLESIGLLLGAGECEEEDSSDEDDNGLKAVGVSPQTSKSVETLINLWNHNCLRSELFADSTSKAIIFRCRSNILTSLANYSFEALGVHEEGVQSACIAASSETNDKHRALIESGVRYNALKCIISDAIEILSMMNECDAEAQNKFQEDLNQGIYLDFSRSLIAFISKILELEEETLGSSLWQKRQSTSLRKNAKQPRNKGTQRPNLSRLLPSLKSIGDAYKENRNQATSLGILLSFDGEPTHSLNDLIMDATRDLSDDMMQILYLQSFLNASRSVLRAIVSTGSISDALEQLLSRIQECQLDNPDSTFIFLAAIGALIPTILGPHGDYTSYIKDISNDIWEAYQSRSFEDSNVAKLSLGLLGLSNLSAGNTVQTIEIVDCLEKTTIGYGGLTSSYAYYALAIIAQKCASTGDSKTNEALSDMDMIQLNRRIVLFLLSELSKCIKGGQEAITILVDSIKNRTVTTEDLGVLSTLQKSSLKVKKSKVSTSRSIFVALGICLPGMVVSNEELLSPTILFLESLQWGSGVGFCLHPILREWRQSSDIGTKEIETKYNEYSKSFEQVVEQQTDGLHEISYALMAVSLKSNSHSIETLRTTRNEEAGNSVSLVLAVSSIASIPCLGNGRRCLVTDSPSLLEKATHTDVANIVEFVSTVSIDMAIIMRGFLASLTNFSGLDHDEDSIITVDPLIDELNGTNLPEAHMGTASEIIMGALHKDVNERNELGLVALLHCLEETALPNQFSILVEGLAKGEEIVKSACMKLLVSQIKGRPRAVFDGRDFVRLACKICKMPAVSVGKMLGELEAAGTFVDAFGEMITKFISQDVELVIENIFQFCIFQFDRNSSLIIKLFQSIRRILQQAKIDKSPRFSPKCLKSIYLFLQQKALSGILKVTSVKADGVPPNQIANVVNAYGDCIALIPETLLVDSNIIYTTGSIGFSGECLRIRLLMSLIQRDSHSLLPHSYRHVTSSIAWMSQQLISCNEGIFLPTLLQASCAVAGAISTQTNERKKDNIVSFLDNLLMVDSSASFVCLEILSAFLFQVCHGHGSDGDLSLLQVLGPSVEKWIDLPPEMLKRTYELAVHDLPFNLARFTRREGLSDVVCNRLSRIYTKWLGQGSNETTLAPLRLSLICCRDAETVANAKDSSILVTSIVSRSD